MLETLTSERAESVRAAVKRVALTQLGAARYVLLARMGQLLPTLGIEAEKVGGRSE